MYELGPGKIYILNPDDSRSFITEIKELGVTAEINENDIPETVKSINSLEASFECVARMSKEMILAITGVKDAILKYCVDERVAHLARYARKKKTRKKNFHRAIRIIEKGRSEK